MPYVRSTLALLAAAAMLGACNNSKLPPMDNPPSPPDLAANFSQPIDAKAADGAWTLKVRGNNVVLSRYAQAALTFSAPGAMIQPHQATWIARLPDNQQVTVKLFASQCTYPATIETHAFVAEVDLPNAPPLSGCGDAVGAPKAAAAPAAPAKAK